MPGLRHPVDRPGTRMRGDDKYRVKVTDVERRDLIMSRIRAKVTEACDPATLHVLGAPWSDGVLLAEAAVLVREWQRITRSIEQRDAARARLAAEREPVPVGAEP